MHQTPKKIVIIADDLTGAADAGVHFCPIFGAIRMCGVDGWAKNGEGADAEGVAVFTNTRNLSAAAAARVVGNVADYVMSSDDAIVYKKIDSSLRGNIGAETQALLTKLGLRACFVAPALPGQRRVTVHDIHTVNGLPVAASGAGRDPLAPVNTSRLSELLAAQSGFRVGHIDLEWMERGADAISSRIASLISDGCRQIAFDAAKDEHLLTIASLARTSFPDCLLAGSAGLASALARVMWAENGTAVVTPPALPDVRKSLFVCGSASGMMAAQREQLANAHGVKIFLFSPGELVVPGRGKMAGSCRAEIASRWKEGGIIVAIEPMSSVDPRFSPERVMRGFAAEVALLIEMTSPDLVFLSGGDTAEAVSRRIGADVILLLEEIVPGLVRGKVATGRFKGMAVVTKAGSFGDRHTLVQLFEMISVKSLAMPLPDTFEGCSIFEHRD